MSKSLDKRFERYETLLNDLIGPVDEWTSAEVEQFLMQAGIDVDSAERHLYDRISEIAGSYRVQNKNVPEHITEFLRQMRPADLPTSDPEVAKSVARTWIDKLLRPQPAFGTPEVAHAFRNRKEELEPQDQALLDRLATELRNRPKKDK